jgi:4-hydroxybenzoate polyprenyltransferase
MISRKNKLLLKKIISLFSVVRGYNIIVIVIAQYLSSLFILAPEKNALSVLFDFYLFIIIIASSLTIASGYIINSFYDSKKDLINRPNKSMLDRLVSQKTKLYFYFTLNFLVAALSFFVSFRAVLFFSVYIFLIWFYSHKIKKHLIIGNLTAAILAILPFFAILLYYKNFYEVIFAHASFLFLLLLVREMTKDLENIKGDLANGYETIPTKYGEVSSKRIITGLALTTIFPIYLLIDVYSVGYMDSYFYFCLIILLLYLVFLWKSATKKSYLFLHNVLKLLILAGVFAIVMINPEKMIHFKNWIFQLLN